MKFVIDMNLSPASVPAFEAEGHEALHWSALEAPDVPDTEVPARSLSENRVVVTNDLDFGAILSVSRGNGPSILPVRTQDVTPEFLGPRLFAAIRQYGPWPESGALVTVDEATARARILPIRS